MTLQQGQGRAILVANIVVVLSISVTTTALYASERGTDRLPAQSVRFVLMAVLLAFVYRGSESAKWLTVVLSGLGGLLAAMNVAKAFPRIDYLSAAMASLYLTFAVMLVASRRVNAFLTRTVRKPIEHPRFGTMKPIGEAWVGRVTLDGWGKGRWPERMDLVLDGDENGPLAGTEALALTLIERRDRLADVILEGVWAELEGRVSDAANHWSGNLTEINDPLDDGTEPILKSSTDLLTVLDPAALFVRKGLSTEALVSGISFESSFEEEHGFEVLTDGEKVLGTGFYGEAEPYPRYVLRTKQDG
jgi:hypothetical protein